MILIKECAIAHSSRPTLPRSGHSSARLPKWHKDDVIIFGGYVEEGSGASCKRRATSESWTYSIDQDRWTAVQYAPGQVPEERLVSQAVVMNDHLWTIGGWNPGMKGDGGVILNDIWKLDLYTYAWQQVVPQGEQLTPISRFQAQAVDQLIYIHTHRSIDDILILDTATDPPTLRKKKVQAADPLNGTPTSRGLHSLVHQGNHMYLFGGAPQQGGMLNDLWQLDLDTLTWTKLQGGGDPPPPGCAHAAAAVGRYLVLFGGAFYSPTGLQVMDDLFLFDTETQQWTRPKVSGPLPTARNAATVVSVDHTQLLLHGGWKAFVETYNDTFLLSLDA